MNEMRLLSSATVTCVMLPHCFRKYQSIIIYTYHSDISCTPPSRAISISIGYEKPSEFSVG